MRFALEHCLAAVMPRRHRRSGRRTRAWHPAGSVRRSVQWLNAISTRISAAIGLALVAACSSGTASDGTIRIRQGDACPHCTIELRDSLTIGSSSGWDVLSPWAAIGLDHDRVLISDVQSYPGQLLVLDPTSGRPPIVIGRQGDGPGELQVVSGAWLEGSEVHVYDNRQQRESVFDSAGNYLRSYPWAFGPKNSVGSRWPLPDGGLLISATVRSREAAGNPLHVLNANRELVRSFGADTAMLLPGLIDLARRAVSKASDGAIWVGRINEYRIEKWSISGEHLQTMDRQVSWFPRWQSVETTDYMAAAPPPRLVAILEDPSSGLLWTMTVLADSRYRPTKRVGDAETPVVVSELDDFFDTVIEAIDIRTSTVLATRRFDEILGVAGQAIVASQYELEDGTIRVRLSRLVLDGQ